MTKDPDRYAREALQYEAMLRACLARMNLSQTDVDELLQETYTRLLILGRTDGPEIRWVRAFARKIATNLALDLIRHRKILPFDPISALRDFDCVDDSLSVEDEIDNMQKWANLDRAIEELPELTRRVWTEKMKHRYSHKKIADLLGISLQESREHLNRAVNHTADRLYDPGNSALPREKLCPWRRVKGKRP